MRRVALPERIEIILVPDSEGYWLAEFPQLPGLHTFGTSLREAKRNAAQALKTWFKEHARAGIPVRVRR